MNNLTCPHCHTDVPRGASVCTGCQAELKYGPSKTLVFFSLVLAAIAGVKVATALPPAMSIAGWIVGITVFGALYMLVTKVYKDRVIFKRIYRTR
jgi:hypothetical protein